MKNKIVAKLSRIALKVSGVIAGLAFLAVSANINTTCVFKIHQPKLPENAKKLRKF